MCVRQMELEFVDMALPLPKGTVMSILIAHIKWPQKVTHAPTPQMSSYHLNRRKEPRAGKAVRYNALDVDVLVFGWTPELQ